MIHLRTPTPTPLDNRIATVLAYGLDPEYPVSRSSALALAATLVVEHHLLADAMRLDAARKNIR